MKELLQLWFRNNFQTDDDTSEPMNKLDFDEKCLKFTFDNIFKIFDVCEEGWVGWGCFGGGLGVGWGRVGRYFREGMYGEYMSVFARLLFVIIIIMIIIIIK